MSWRLTFLAALVLAAGPALAAPAETERITVYGKRERRLFHPSAAELSGRAMTIEEAGGYESLERNPAIDVQHVGGDASSPRFVIRGQATIENRYFLEGFPLTNARFNEPDLDAISPHFIDSAEVYASGIPLGFASDGLGGAINFRLAELSGPTRVLTRAGSFGHYGVHGDASLADRSARIAIDYTEAKDDFVFFDDNGTPTNPSDDAFRRRANNGARRITLVPRYRPIDRRDLSVELLGVHTLARREVPGPTFGSPEGALAGYTQLTGIRARGEVGSVGLESHAYLRLKREELEDIPSWVGASTRTFRSAETAGGLRAQARVWPARLDLVGGVEAEHATLTVTDGPGSSAHTRWQAPVGIGADLALGDFSVRPAVQAHWYHYATEGVPPHGLPGATAPRDREFLLVSPRVGMRFSPGDRLVFHAALGRYYRAPTLFELYGSPLGISPNETLRPETALSAELGAGVSLEGRGAIRSWRLGYTCAVSRATNLITHLQNAQRTAVAVNVGKSRIVSHEIESRWETRAGIRLDVSATFLSTENLSNVSYERGRRLPHRPPVRLRTGIGYRKGALDIGYQLTWLDATYADLSNSRRVGSQFHHGAAVALRTARWGRFVLEGRNLTDSLTATSTYASSDLETKDYTTGYPGYPAPGRRVYLTWLYAF